MAEIEFKSIDEYNNISWEPTKTADRYFSENFRKAVAIESSRIIDQLEKNNWNHGYQADLYEDNERWAFDWVEKYWFKWVR